MNQEAQREVQNHFVVEPWASQDAPAISQKLEHPNWSPWMEASIATLAKRSVVFRQGQLLIKDLTGAYTGSLSLNRISWDGDRAHLPTRDEVTGWPTDYEKTYDPRGNTLVCLYMNIAPAFKGQQIPGRLIDEALRVARRLGIEHLTGSFRPSGFGRAKKELGFDLDFAKYCFERQPESDRPVDPWLRSLSWKGAKLLAVTPDAVRREVSLSEFEHYKNTYKPERWYEPKVGLWECEELGAWKIDKDKGMAIYIESNIWGEILLAC